MPRTLEGLGQPAKLPGKATPQVKRASSCKPRVSVSKVQILKRQGLQFAGRSCRPSRRRVSSPGYLAPPFRTRRNKYTKSAARGEARTKNLWVAGGWRVVTDKRLCWAPARTHDRGAFSLGLGCTLPRTGVRSP